MMYSEAIIRWYEEHKRDLPWRHSSDPYIIWISEIILQQTRVAQGMDYFRRFVERFPDVQSLAAAPEDEVLKYWQGLGYYSRARNLHAAARAIVERGGSFPEKYEEVLSLKGIGEYTAAAIVSFAWNQPYPVVDGNVYRVLSRLFAVETPIDTTRGKKEFAGIAAEILDRKRPGLHNQAIMELGALQCVPANPDCAACPVGSHCLAYQEGRVPDFPVKQGKTKTRARYFHFFHISCEGKTALQRRERKDIWQGLYQFPLIETERETDFAELQASEAFRQIFGDCGELHIRMQLRNVKHVLSHQTLYATFYHVRLARFGKYFEESCLVLPENEADAFAVPRLLEIYREKTEGKFAF